MKKALLWGAALAALGVAAAVWFGRSGPTIEDGSYLVVDLGGKYVEAVQSPIGAQLFSGAPRPLIALLSEFTKAERDPQIAGVLLRVRPLEIGWGKAQEIRDAILRLQGKEKRVLAYLELEKFGANLEYYVASAADQVYVAPGTRNPLVGLAAEYFFLGGLFERFGISVEYERVGDYKSAVETFVNREMSAPAREMANWILDSIDDQFVSGIATSRGLSDETVRAAVDAGPTTPTELQKFGLIDGVRFFDEIVDQLDAPVVKAEEYARVDPDRLGFSPELNIALIYGAGPVVTGEGSAGLRGNSQLASETVSKALIEAAENDEIDAILLRIDSPGGSALASDLVWHATQRVKRKGKPVIASFSDVAASGGYYVAAGADVIVASPATITGSIGVFVLRPVLGEFFEKFDIGVASETRGRFADLLLATEPLSDATRERLRHDVESVYESFVSRVAEGRSLEKTAVDDVGRGRVFTGVQAKERGLVDVLGGFRAAVAEAKRATGHDPEADALLIPFPAPKNLLEQLREGLGASARAWIRTPMIDPLIDWSFYLAEIPSGAPVMLPPFIPHIQ